MNELFSSFQASSKEQWISILTKELKGESIDSLQKINRVEEIAFPSYFHRHDQTKAFSDPGMAPFTRGIFSKNNEWMIASPIRIGNERDTNQTILALLMSGTNHLVLEAQSLAAISFENLLKEVGLEHIYTTLIAQSKEQITDFLAYSKNAPVSIVYANSDELIGLETAPNVKLFHVDGYSVQQAGGTTWQELAVSLAEGHEWLVKQLDAGVDCDTAAARIHFTFGIGSKFFFEVSKIRAFRTAWSKIVSQYSPKHTCSLAASITAKTGFVSTSLKDPYTNLLRQTTEAMSAVIAGVQHLQVQPYDWYSNKPDLNFTQRMATNISLLLQEESYFHLVVDPAGGSYAIDNLTETIAERAWSSFQWIERNGGIRKEAVIAQLKQEITEKAEMRVAELKDKTEKRIGINVFPNPETVTNEWAKLPPAWAGLSPLILEQTL